MSEHPLSTEPVTGRTSLWRRRPVQIGAAVAVIAVAAGVYFATSSSATPQVHVRGTLNLGLTAAVDPSNSDALNPVAGDACESAGGYSDIAPGTAVAVGGSSGQALGVGALSAGVETPGGYCAFSFDVAVPGGQSLYTVTISHRGTQTFTPTQVAAGIHLTLGN